MKLKCDILVYTWLAFKCNLCRYNLEPVVPPMLEAGLRVMVYAGVRLYKLNSVYP